MEALHPEQGVNEERRHAPAHIGHLHRHGINHLRHARAMAAGERAAAVGGLGVARLRRGDVEAVEGVRGHRQSRRYQSNYHHQHGKVVDDAPSSSRATVAHRLPPSSSPHQAPLSPSA